MKLRRACLFLFGCAVIASTLGAADCNRDVTGQCPGQTRRCGGQCVPVDGNCEQCGQPCPALRQCGQHYDEVAYRCLCVESCGRVDSCVDLQSDPQNCGSCLRKCGSNEACVDSVCVAGPTDAAPDVDASSDGSSDASSDAGQAVLFMTGVSTQTVYRSILNPPPSDGGATQGPQATDGGSFSLFTKIPGPLSYSASPQTIFVVEAQNPDAGVESFANPFGAFSASKAFGATDVTAMTYGLSELWLVSQGMSGGNLQTWSSAGTKTWNMDIASSRALAIDEATKSLYVLTGPTITRYIVTGTAASKTLTPTMAGGLTVLDAGIFTSMTVTPWGQLLVVSDGKVLRFDLSLSPLPSYTLPFTNGIAVSAIKWGSGIREIFIADSQGTGVKRWRCAPDDAPCNTPLDNGSIDLPTGDTPFGMVVAQ